MNATLTDTLQMIRSELSGSKALSLLLENEKLAQKEHEEFNSFQSLQLLTAYKKEIIYLTIEPHKREYLWKILLQYLSKCKVQKKEFELEYGYTYIDYIEDELAFNQVGFLNNSHIDRQLVKNISCVDKCFKETQDYRFLILKSIYLRFKARYFCTLFSDRVNRIEEALKCLIKAEILNKEDVSVYIQKGLVLFFKSSINSRSQDIYSASLKLAEHNFLTAISISHAPLAYLSLCYFYRFTFQSDACCIFFINYIQLETNKRRLYRNSYLLGEAVFSLSFKQRPKELMDSFFIEANDLLDTAISSGYEMPRLLLSKAITSALLNKIDYASTYVFKLFSKSGEFSWTRLSEISEKAMGDFEKQNYIDNAVLNGVTDSSIWNNLGTFAKTFLQNYDLAENCYRIARVLSPNNSVVLTNLARLLLETESQNIDEISFYIEQAEEKSDHRFYWWRVVKDDFEMKYGKIKFTTDSKFRRKAYQKDEYAETIRKYESLKKMEDAFKRGKELEILIIELLRNNNINSLDEYKNAMGRKSYIQIDGAFVFDHKYYMIEAKWTKAKSDIQDVSQIERRLMNGLTDNYGLLISHAGFTTSAVDQALQYSNKDIKIILMDGEELEDAIQYNCIIDCLLTKQLELHLHKNPYFKFRPKIQNDT